MSTVRVILSILYILDCIALTVVVLMQEGKQQGLGALAGTTDTFWGKNKGRSREGILKKTTTAMAVIFMLLAIVLNLKIV